MADFESKGGNLPPPGGDSPERGPKVRVYELKGVKVNSGSWEERGKAYLDGYIPNKNITNAPEFQPGETRGQVDMRLINLVNL